MNKIEEQNLELMNSSEEDGLQMALAVATHYSGEYLYLIEFLYEKETGRIITFKSTKRYKNKNREYGRGILKFKAFLKKKPTTIEEIENSACITEIDYEKGTKEIAQINIYNSVKEYSKQYSHCANREIEEYIERRKIVRKEDIVKKNLALMKNNEKGIQALVREGTLGLMPKKPATLTIGFSYEKETGKIIKLTGSRSKLAKNKEQGIGFFEITLKLNLKEAEELLKKEGKELNKENLGNILDNSSCITKIILEKGTKETVQIIFIQTANRYNDEKKYCKNCKIEISEN